jgi:hypothetical protein
MLYIETPRPNTNRDIHAHMFALCENRTRDLLRSRRVFPPLRQIGRQYACYWITIYKDYLLDKNNVTQYRVINVRLRINIINQFYVRKHSTMSAKNILLALCVILYIHVSDVNTARILGVFPTPAKSHQAVFVSYVQELAKRGHELVIISPEKINDETSGNITHIDIIAGFGDILELLNSFQKYQTRGVITDVNDLLDRDMYREFLKVFANSFELPEVRALVNDKQQKFDLVVVEAFFEYQLIFSEIFKAPTIMIASFMGFPEHYEMLGAVGRHPKYYPHLHRMYHSNLGIWGTLRELYLEYKLYTTLRGYGVLQDELLKQNFGPEAPTTEQMKENVDMLFLSVHPMFVNNMPVPPNILYFHAPHLQPEKTLPEVILILLLMCT